MAIDADLLVVAARSRLLRQTENVRPWRPDVQDDLFAFGGGFARYPDVPRSRRRPCMDERETFMNGIALGLVTWPDRDYGDLRGILVARHRGSGRRHRKRLLAVIPVGCRARTVFRPLAASDYFTRCISGILARLSAVIGGDGAVRSGRAVERCEIALAGGGLLALLLGRMSCGGSCGHRDLRDDPLSSFCCGKPGAMPRLPWHVDLPTNEAWPRGRAMHPIINVSATETT